MAIGKTNAVSGGGGGVGAVLTVTAPAGVTVSVSKDGKTKTKTANVDGLAVFKGLATGTWTLTITDGVQTSTTTVVITADYNATIAFFSATINITYPAGSTCTCSDGSTTFTAPDTSGTWVCIVPNTGTWTVNCTDGVDSTSETVSITADGQSVAVELAFLTGVLYRKGNECTDITGGWAERFYVVDGYAAATVNRNADSIQIVTDNTTEHDNVYLYTANPIDLTKYNTLNINVLSRAGISNNSYKGAHLYINTSKPQAGELPEDGVASVGISSSGVVSLDISAIKTGKHYVTICCYGASIKFDEVAMK